MGEAELYAKQDQEVKERVEARNDLEQYTYNLKRQVEDKDKLADKLSDEDKEKLSNVIRSTLDWLQDNDEGSVDDFKDAKKKLEDIAQPIVAKIYQQGGGGESEGSDNAHAEDEL